MKIETKLDINLSAFNGKTIAVLGLGKSGLPAANALKKFGANILAWDDDVSQRNAAKKQGLPLVDLNNIDMKEVSLMLLSPGIPLAYPSPHPVVNKAKIAGCEIVCDIEILARAEPNAFFVGITGTNGKSTTTALIGHLLNRLGKKAVVGGNIGQPALTLSSMGESGIYVLEISSYQLELLSSATFNLSVLLNISPDHIDRHGSMEGYISAKRRIFSHTSKTIGAIIGVDDTICRDIHKDLSGGETPVIAISAERPICSGVYVEKGWLVDNRYKSKCRIIDLSKVERLPGLHNAQNTAAAYAAVSLILKEDETKLQEVADSISDFPGLEHRQELIAKTNGCRFINDSKATNANATARALECNNNIIWIAGGRAKEGGIEELTSYFSKILHVFLIGESALEFAKTLEGKAPYSFSGDLIKATEKAIDLAIKEDRPCVVLLSPACSSFDQFPDFETRGKTFRDTVKNLLGNRP